MPNDFKSDHPTWTCSVIDRLDNSLPFSRGLLATSILATGIDTPSAYEVARVIQERLYRSGAERIDSEALIRMTAEEIARLVSNEVADRYLLWRKARRIGRPIIISLLGSSGVGKSTLATRLALRLGVNRVVTTDSIREVLRTVIPNSVLPELHVSSYEEIETDLPEAQSSTYHRQSRAVVAACAAIARRYVHEQRNVLFEGVHLLPGYLSRELKSMDENPIVVEVLLTLKDERLHTARLNHRLAKEPGRDGRRNLMHFEIIRSLQENMRGLAEAAAIPEFDVGSDQDLTQKIVREIVTKALG
ncbi:MAG: ATP cone domain-containing protein [Hyphomicrobiaceae bacterium]